MRSFLKNLLLKTPVRIVLGLAAAYFLFAWFGFEPLVKWAGPKFIADKSRHVLVLDAARFDPLALSLELRGLKLTEPDGKPLLAFDRLFVDFAAASLLRWTYTLDRIELSAPQARVELKADGSLNWSALLEALKSKEEEEDKPLPRLLIRRLALEKGKLEFADHKAGFATALTPIDFTLTDLSTLPDDKGAYNLAATTQWGARIRWKGEVGLKPVVAAGELAIDQLALARLWPYVGRQLNLEAPAGVAALALKYRAGYADKRVSLALEQLGFTLEGLALRGKGWDHDALTLDRIALKGGRFDLGQRQLDLGEIVLSGGKVDLRRDSAGRLDVLDWLPPAKAEAAPAPAPASASASLPVQQGEPWRLQLPRFALNGLALRIQDAGFKTPLSAEIGNIQLDFAARAEAGGELKARVEPIHLALSGLRLASGKNPVFVLGGLKLDAGQVDLAARSAHIGRITLANGKVEVTRDAQGKIALLDAFQPAQTPSPARPAAAADPSHAAPWRYGVDEIALAGFQTGYRDETVQPAAALTLEKIEASVRNISQDLKQALPVKLGFRVKEGGVFQAAGKVQPVSAQADIHLKLDGLALTPAQPWLSQAANLALASGRFSSQGRLRYAPKEVSFQGGFAVEDFLLNESETGARFLAWKRMGSDSLEASLAGVALEELKLDGLGAKFIIHQDKSLNLKKILKSAPPPPAEAEPAPPAAAVQQTPFRFSLDRIRVSNGEVDFADLSLSLPFGARIHEFKGAVNGISSQPGQAAELELDGRVDEYGLARVVGQVDLFNPTGFMDIKTVFRNVEMANLTPYTATFAGYKIASGKLSLDLEYKIKQRQLLGENQILLDRLTLGEKLEGPNVKHLPLELAIAILEDSDGRIDLGLPVSGSLDDPQFSYGRIIWKAIGNILGKIVTAPFRALANLFGGGGEKLEKIAFEAGDSQLTPPEKEKFKQISQVLQKRPRLALTVHGAWSPEIDRPVLRERQLRRAVAEKMGIKLAPDEDPGPLSTGNPKARAGIEAVYAARFGETEWKALEAKWRKANPEKKEETGKMMSRLKGLFSKPEEPLSQADQTALQGADLHALLYARLQEKETVTDAALQQLGEQRARAIVEGLANAGAPGARIQAAAAEAFQGEGREVPVKLELGVAKP